MKALITVITLFITMIGLGQESKTETKITPSDSKNSPPIIISEVKKPVQNLANENSVMPASAPRIQPVNDTARKKENLMLEAIPE